MTQLQNIANLPFLFKHVAVMPDCHMGKGSTVGSVIVTRDAVIPSSVGVDIGCGVAAVLTNLTAKDLPDSLASLRSSIERAVPVGRYEHSSVASGKDGSSLFSGLVVPSALSSMLNTQKVNAQVGTLGGGNHFIEICLDTEDKVWIMLHSGSRNSGKVIGEHFISKARSLMDKYYIGLTDPDLAYLPQHTTEFQEYLSAVEWAQDYASLNRQVMMKLVFKEIKYYFKHAEIVGTEVNCHHNYISRESHYGQNVIVTRKGAVRARTGDIVIIPGSMGTCSYIGEGLGNPESFHSCSHGAGRKMSRTAARSKYTKKDLENQTMGVECRKDEDVIDEIPAAYKQIDVVMENQKDLVRPLHKLKQILCVKG